ncbi:MAG: cation transporter dimerization domain-containing protein, partial [Dehalococcoidia bacterium]|nr:cation transporter dimerization domain-containing protein [Dehalococcoidia bacterium]
LLDVKLPDDEEEQVMGIITEHYGDLVGFHDLRTRKAGSERHLDLHLVLPLTSTVLEAHALCDHLEGEIMSRLPHSSVTIHIEPCEAVCVDCFCRCTLNTSLSPVTE